MAKVVLLKAENAILEVHEDSDDEEVEEPDVERKEEDTADKTDEWVNVETDAAQGSSERSRATRRPNAIKINEARARHAQDDFGDELPTTPGGWNEEWL